MVFISTFPSLCHHLEYKKRISLWLIYFCPTFFFLIIKYVAGTQTQKVSKHDNKNLIKKAFIIFLNILKNPSSYNLLCINYETNTWSNFKLTLLSGKSQ